MNLVSCASRAEVISELLFKHSTMEHRTPAIIIISYCEQNTCSLHIDTIASYCASVLCTTSKQCTKAAQLSFIFIFITVNGLPSAVYYMSLDFYLFPFLSLFCVYCLLLVLVLSVYETANSVKTKLKQW